MERTRAYDDGGGTQKLRPSIRGGSLSHSSILTTIDLIISIAPLAFGSAIYLLYRPKTIVVFKLIRAIGLNEYIDDLRNSSQSIIPIGRGILLYSVPQGLWAFSFLYVILLIWRPNTARPMAVVSIFCALIVIEGSEIAQLSFLPGTFDINDMICNTVGIALAGGVAYARRNPV